MSSLRRLLSVFGKRSNIVKLLNGAINQRFAFIHLSKINLGEIEVKMPSLSPTMTEGTIVKWIKKEGDTIEPGDVLCEIQTDKAVVGLEVEEEGVLSKILVPEDTKNVPLGKIIAILLTEGEVTVEKDKVEEPIKVEEKKAPTIQSGSPRLCGPSVKKLLAEYGIEPSDIPATGPQANLLKIDVLSYIEKKNLKLAPIPKDKPKPLKKTETKAAKGTSHHDIQITEKTKAAAQQFVFSKTTIPHAYMKVDCKIDKIVNYQNSMEKDGIIISLNDFIIKCTAKALNKVPEMGSEDSNGHINISSTIVNDSGCMSSLIKNADRLPIHQISENAKVTVGENKAVSGEIKGNSFRIFNLGALGVTEFSPVLHQTEIGALAVGAVQFSFEEHSLVQRIRLTLSFNNEVINESEAASFMSHLKEFLENPLSISLT